LGSETGIKSYGHHPGRFVLLASINLLSSGHYGQMPRDSVALATRSIARM
jgi:hypothetical protein